jgi:hypothetical protein
MAGHESLGDFIFVPQALRALSARIVGDTLPPEMASNLS